MTLNKLAGLDKTSTGVIAGVIGPFFGFLLYSWYFTWKYSQTFSFFVNSIILGPGGAQAEVISLSLIFNLLLFFLCLQYNMNRAARGILGAMFIYALIIIYFKFFA